MKRACVVLLGLWLVLPLPALADDTDAALRIADTSWNAMRLQPDVEGLNALLVEDWHLTHSDGRVQDKADYLRELSERSRANQVIENQDVEVRRYGDSAVVTGTSVQAGTRDGQPWSGRFRFTRVWIQREGKWRMVASHSSRIASQE